MSGVRQVKKISKNKNKNICEPPSAKNKNAEPGQHFARYYKKCKWNSQNRSGTYSTLYNM
jgi:hypothetical protein